MKQIIQNLKSGETILEEVPAPKAGRGQIVIQTTRSLVSLGTERMLVEFGKASLLSKARQQPDKVKQVLDKIKTDGLLPTLEAVFNKLDTPLPLGYCNVGRVRSVGEGVSEFKVGDRVASNGSHAEFVAVPKNLAAKIPDPVTDEEATFTVIGSIGLQGVRLLAPTLGETVAVIGLGLIGLIAAELLMANGCTVIGIDLDEEKLKIARTKGILAVNPRENDPVKWVEQHTSGIGADAVLIAASAKTNDIIGQAAKMSRKRGRIVLVGVIGLELNRADFFEKELSFQVSCSYGPGRYDDQYEQAGQDYPLPFVRWTEKRNFETILSMLATKRMDVLPLITERVDLVDFQKIYGNMSSKGSIASIIQYPAESSPATTVYFSERKFVGQRGVIGIIGAGNFTAATMMPALKKAGATIKYIASSKGLSGSVLAKKYGISCSTTDYWDILKDPEVDAVVITTRHNAHAHQVVEALQAGKHVFVEKPLALAFEEIALIELESEKSGKSVTVGFNRRFSPFSIALRNALGNQPGPISAIATMNAGFIPHSHWVHDLQVGGGRIVGEACHLIDLITSFTGSLVDSVCLTAMGENPEESTDCASLLLRYQNGSLGTVNYFSNGSKSYSKERVEVYSQGRTAIIDNFLKADFHGFSAKSFSKTQDKGHTEQFRLWLERLKNGGAPIVPFSETLNSSRAAIAAIESLKTGGWVKV